MEENYLYRYPRDLDKELILFATAPIVNVYVKEESGIREDNMCGSPYSTIVIEITNPNGIINRYVMISSVSNILIFLNHAKREKEFCSYLDLDYGDDPRVILSYSHAKEQLELSITRDDTIVWRSDVISVIPKDITKIVMKKLEEVLPEYAALGEKIRKNEDACVCTVHSPVLGSDNDSSDI